MTAEEFIKACPATGMCSATIAKQYVKENPKDSYDLGDDVIKARRAIVPVRKHKIVHPHFGYLTAQRQEEMSFGG